MSGTWKQRLQRSLHLSRSKPEAKYFQMATVSVDGRPDNRTLVFRGFSEETGALLAVTDTRSEKLGQLLANPFTSIAWYFTKSREQYRINGNVSILVDNVTDVGEVDARSNQVVEMKDLTPFWNKMSEATRQQFYWPHPRRPVAQTDKHPADTTKLSPFFAVLRIHPSEVQYLALKAQPQLREIHSLRDDRWSIQVVNA